MEAITDVEMNAVERAIVVAERDLLDTVAVPTRLARALVTGAGAYSEDQVEEMKESAADDAAEEVRSEVSDALRPASSALEEISDLLEEKDLHLVRAVEEAIEKAEAA